MAEHSRFHQEYPDGKPGFATGNPSGDSVSSSMPNVKTTVRDGGSVTQVSNRSLKDIAGDGRVPGTKNSGKQSIS